MYGARYTGSQQDGGGRQGRLYQDVNEGGRRRRAVGRGPGGTRQPAARARKTKGGCRRTAAAARRGSPKRLRRERLHQDSSHRPVVIFGGEENHDKAKQDETEIRKRSTTRSGRAVNTSPGRGIEERGSKSTSGTPPLGTSSLSTQKEGNHVPFPCTWRPCPGPWPEASSRRSAPSRA